MLLFSLKNGIYFKTASDIVFFVCVFLWLLNKSQSLGMRLCF